MKSQPIRTKARYRDRNVGIRVRVLRGVANVRNDPKLERTSSTTRDGSTPEGDSARYGNYSANKITEATGG
jgi:hypothetical protein